MLLSNYCFRTLQGLSLILLFVLANHNTAIAQGNCDCTNCPQFMQDNFIGSFLINVQNASNPTLGQNGQGVCGVNLNFNHEYIGDLSITLTSPSGQSVTLVGPIGLFGETDGTSWNIAFLPCADPVDPDPGFNGTWSNNQPWGLGGTYTGSYHPSSGCLENFNSGPVNGTWTLTVVDGQPSDVGNFLDYEIIFCDPSGIDCFSCAANAGQLLQPDVVSCEGAPALALNLPPTYTPATTQPPATEYSYTYVIGGAGGVILDFDPSADLSSYPPGIYTVCGMSYLTAQSALIPTPNGTLTVNQLRNLLNASTAPFCGKIGTNCVNVTINAAPEDVEDYVEICAPQCYQFNNISRCQSGTYVATLLQNGCPYTSTLHLTVGTPKITNLTEVICEGGCSINPAFPGVCTTGSHTQVLETFQGCDSTVNLNLTVLPVLAIIANSPVIPCGGGTVMLSGNGSSSGGGYTYKWTASNGGVLVGQTALINASASAAGDYQLKVCRTLGGVTCCDSASVTLTASTNTPPAPTPVTGLVSLCQGQTLNYSIPGTSGASSYTWTVPTGVTINSGANTVNTNLTWGNATGGQICVTANNGCGPSAPTCIDITVNATPTASVPQGSATVCAANNSTYSIPTVTNATNYMWTVNAPAQIVSGQGTSSVQIAWNGATSANLCVSTSNACGTSTQQCLPITVNAIPVTPTISGANNACTQATGTYSVVPIPNATTYLWSVTGGVVTSGNGTPSADITWNNNATTGNVCVKAINTCGESTETCFSVTLGTPPPQPSISGINSLCPGDTAVFNATTIVGASGYIWGAPVGATIISGQNTTSATIVFTTAPGGNVSVAVNGSCGTAPQVNFPVTVNVIPTANAGTDIIQCGNAATLNAANGAGVWTQVGGTNNTIFANASNFNTGITAPQSGTYTYRWTVNTAGCAASDDITVLFEPLPAAGANTILCNNTNDSYTVSFPINFGTAPFTVLGGTVTNGVFISDPIVSGTPYQFTINDVNNCKSPIIQGSYNCNCATNAGSMSLMPLQACGNETVTAVQQTLPVLDANDIGIFMLHEGSGTTIVNPIAQNTTGLFGFQTGMNFGQTYYISYAVGNNNNGVPNATDLCYSVAQGQPVTFFAVPMADAGPTVQNCGTSITLAGAGAGTWSVLTSPTNGSVQFTNAADPVTTVSTNVFGTYTLQWVVSANGCSTTDQTQITFNPTPSVANIDRICDPTNQSYTVNFNVSGGTSPYLINTTTFNGTAYVSPALNNGQTYTFTISDSQGCTTSSISGSYACNCATDAGTMNNAPLKACATQTVQAAANNDTNLDGDDIISYILHDEPGTTLGTILDQNTTGVFGFKSGMILGQTYYISRVAGNPIAGLVDPMDPCFSVSAGQEVVFLEIPAPNAGLDLANCGTQINLAGVPSSFSGTWSFVSGPGTVNIATPQALNSGVSVTQAGSYLFKWTATNDICTGSDQIQVQFNALPSANITDENCNNTNTQYAVLADLSGGTAPYLVNGLTGTVAGNTFTSDLIATNTTYNITITDANGCTFGPVTGVKNCNCATDAGSMQSTALTFCADEPAIGSWNNDAQLDGNDIVRFVLHSGQGVSLGQVFATSDSAQFNFGAGLVLGQTYYISAIAGNGNSGVVDVSDPCFSVAAGTPVKWKALPNATIAGTTAICEGGTSTLTFNGTGVYPLTVNWQDSNGQVETSTITGTQGGSASVQPLATTIYTLNQVTDGAFPTCSTDLNQQVTITVNSLAGAGFPDSEGDVCANAPEVFQLRSLLIGEDNGGTWTEVSTVPSNNGAFNAANGSFNTDNQATGTYLFRYKVSATAPCPPDEAVVTIHIRPLPAVDAGTDQIIDCNTPLVVLGGNGTGSAANLAFQWSRNNVEIPEANKRFTDASEGGIYTLMVTNAFGCTNTDEVSVSTNLEQPIIKDLLKQPISCFGEKDGQIQVTAIEGGTPPYLLSINGASFSSSMQFGPLSAGIYTIEVTDANGCTSVIDNIEVVEPPQLLAELGLDTHYQLGDIATIKALLNLSSLAQLDTIIWTPLVDSTGVGTTTQKFVPIRSGGIQVFIRDSNGCVANDRMEYTVDRRRNVYVPNIIYPSGSENNIATVFGGNDVAEVKYFKVFDRWGAQIHETTNFQPGDLNKGWNGTIDNRVAQPAVFVWTVAVLFKDGEIEVFTGDITVIR
jgi:PKD-like domain/Proprotein convertase P-domain